MYTGSGRHQGKTKHLARNQNRIAILLADKAKEEEEGEEEMYRGYKSVACH
jgi:hypothetical protein